MKELRVLFDDSNGMYLAWEKSKIANKYVILGKDDTFNDMTIKETTNNVEYIKTEELKGMVAVTVEYMVTDEKTHKDVVIDRTTTELRSLNIFKVLLVKAIKSFKGISISFASNVIYDRYYVYEKKDGKYTKIIETEDFQVTSSLFKEGNTYYIEGFKKEENGDYSLKAKSQDFELVTEDYVYNVTEPKIAIVMPAYNIARILHRTIDSIIFSSLKDIELIMLNDGSKDKTIEVMNWYKNKYPGLITVIDKENEGQAITRYKGLSYVHAKYTFFMDADDMVHPEMFKKMYECIEREQADFVMNKIIFKSKFNESSIYFNHIDDTTSETRCLVEDYETYIKNKHNGSYNNFYLVTLWHQIGKTEIYKAHKMPHFDNYEDIAYVRLVSAYGNKFAFQMDSYYVWDRRIGNYLGSSSTRSVKKDSTEKKIQMYVDAVFYFVNDYDKDRLELLYYDALNDVVGYIEPTLNAIKNGNKYNNDNLYIEHSYKYFKMHDLLNMPLIMNNERLTRMIREVILLKENIYDE